MNFYIYFVIQIPNFKKYNNLDKKIKISCILLKIKTFWIFFFKYKIYINLYRQESYTVINKMEYYENYLL